MKAMGIQNLIASTLVGVIALFTTATAQPADTKPNVVFILADNVGYGDWVLTAAASCAARHAAHRSTRLRRPAPDAVSGRARLHAVARGADDRAILDPQRPVADHRAGQPQHLPKGAFTMGQLFKGAGYATAIFGKWQLGGDPQSLPTAHGFDEFYGIPPDSRGTRAPTLTRWLLTHSMNEPLNELLAKGPQIVEAVAGGPCAQLSRLRGRSGRDRHH